MLKKFCQLMIIVSSLLCMNNSILASELFYLDGYSKQELETVSNLNPMRFKHTYIYNKNLKYDLSLTNYKLISNFNNLLVYYLNLTDKGIIFTDRVNYIIDEKNNKKYIGSKYILLNNTLIPLESNSKNKLQVNYRVNSLIGESFTMKDNNIYSAREYGSIFNYFPKYIPISKNIIYLEFDNFQLINYQENSDLKIQKFEDIDLNNYDRILNLQINGKDLDIEKFNSDDNKYIGTYQSGKNLLSVYPNNLLLILEYNEQNNQFDINYIGEYQIKDGIINFEITDLRTMKKYQLNSSNASLIKFTVDNKLFNFKRLNYEK